MLLSRFITLTASIGLVTTKQRDAARPGSGNHVDRNGSDPLKVNGNILALRAASRY
jgi:hypothetical protein